MKILKVQYLVQYHVAKKFQVCIQDCLTLKPVSLAR